MGNWTKILFAIIFTLTCHQAKAQFEMPEYGMRSSGMGGCSVALTDIGSGIENIASLAHLDACHISFSTVINHSIPELSTQNIALTFSTWEKGAWIIRYQHFGNAHYHEQKSTVGYAMALGQSISIGAALHYMHSGCADAYYQRQNLITFSASMQYLPTEELIVGIKLFNPAMVRFQSNEELRTPAIMQAGVTYDVTDRLTACLEIEKQTFKRPIIKTGLEYEIIQNIRLQTGVASNPMRYSFGINAELANMQLGIAIQTHQTLGISPHIGLTYHF